MNKFLILILRKIFSKIYAICPPPQDEKLSYVARCLGAHNLNLNLRNYHDFKRMGGDYFPNYILPRSWNEKVGYYLSNYYYRSPIATATDHKYLAKKIIKEWAGEQYVVPTYGVWDRIEDIDWNKLPESFILKSSIGYQGKQVIVVHNKDAIDKNDVFATMQEHLRNQYKGFTHKRVIAEKLLLNHNGSMPVVYDFYCGRGNPLVCSVRHYLLSGLKLCTDKLVFYDIHNWQKLPVQYANVSGGLFPNDKDIEMPANLDEMLLIAGKISSHVPICRVDLYSVERQIYVGEITLGPWGGFFPMFPSEWDFHFGESVDIISTRELDKMIIRDIAEFSLDEITSQIENT